MIPPSNAAARSVPLAAGKKDASIDRHVVIPDRSSRGHPRSPKVTKCTWSKIDKTLFLIKLHTQSKLLSVFLNEGMSYLQSAALETVPGLNGHEN